MELAALYFALLAGEHLLRDLVGEDGYAGHGARLTRKIEITGVGPLYALPSKEYQYKLESTNLVAQQGAVAVTEVSNGVGSPVQPAKNLHKRRFVVFCHSQESAQKA